LIAILLFNKKIRDQTIESLEAVAVAATSARHQQQQQQHQQRVATKTSKKLFF